MISIEVLKQVSVVYTHAHCPDGLASAMILKDAFRMLGMTPRIEFLTHGTPEHQAATDTTEQALFCDIAPRAGSGSWLQRHLWPVVLDHHKGAEDLVLSFGDRGVFADEKLEPGVSGALLAFREVWDAVLTWWAATHAGVLDPSANISAVRDFAKCVGARDTWQTQDARFQRGQWISKALMSKPASYWLNGEPLHPNPSLAPHVPFLTDEEITVGRALFEAHEEAVRQAVEQCVEFSVPEGSAEMRLFVFQEQASGFRLCSDVAEALREKPPHFQAVIAGFSYVVDKPGAEPRVIYSLRGIGGFDVAAFAKSNGGGGHTAAAGFAVPLDEVDVKGPYAHVRLALRKFLQAR